MANGASAVNCSACVLSFTKDEIVVRCHGFCGKSFHSGCTPLTNNEIRLLKPKTGIVWLCEACRMLTGEGQSFLQLLQEINNRILLHGKLLDDHGHELKEVNTTLSKLKPPTTHNVNKRPNDIYKQQPVSLMQQPKQVSIVNNKKEDTNNKIGMAPLLSEAQLPAATTSNADKTGDLEQEFTIVQHRKNKKRQRKSIVGTAPVDEASLRAVVTEKKAWFHVSRYPLDTTSIEVQEMLNKKFNRTDFTCDKIKTHHPSPTFSSFKIGTDYSLLEQLEDPSIWAKGIKVARFNFFERVPGPGTVR